MKITFLYFLLQPARWYKSNRRHLFVSLRLWRLRPGSYPQFNNPQPSDWKKTTRRAPRWTCRRSTTSCSWSRASWSSTTRSLKSATRELSQKYWETYNYLDILTRWVYYPEFPNLWNHSNCPEQCCLISKRIGKKYWKSLTAMVKVLVQKEIRQHFAGPMPLLHLPQLCRLWHEQQHGVRSKGTSLKIRSDSGLPQSYIVSLNHENHESWI